MSCETCNFWKQKPRAKTKGVCIELAKKVDITYGYKTFITHSDFSCNLRVAKED